MMMTGQTDIDIPGRGSVYVTGRNQEGQLGLGHRSDTTLFQLMPPFCHHAPIKMLSAGCNTSATLTEDGRVFVRGDNSVGQIGLGEECFALEPRELYVGQPVTWVSCGYHHSALVTEEDVYTFGRGQYGQLGQGTFLFAADLPKALQVFHHGSVCQVTCGQGHTALITRKAEVESPEESWKSCSSRDCGTSSVEEETSDIRQGLIHRAHASVQFPIPKEGGLTPEPQEGGL
ncbi:unnamed protein product [Lota lota]